MGTTSPARGIELYKGARDESIRIKFQYRGAECRESLKLPHTKANINYAIRLRGEILNAIEKGTFRYADYFPDSSAAARYSLGPLPSRVTVGELLREQMKIAKRALSPSTVLSYQEACDLVLLPKWDKVPVSELTPAALRAWLGEFTCKLKSIRNYIQPLSNALAQAVNDDIIEANPLARVKLTKIFSREQRKSDFLADPFDMNEIAAILDKAKGQERNFWQFALATGMRTSELVGLEWGSIDWVNCRVHVERVKVVGVVKEETKTDAGTRKVDMRQGALEALKDQQQYTYLAGKTVFNNPFHDEPWNDNKAIRRRWNITLLKAGVRYRNPYQTRHTFASTLLSAGENPLYVAKQMGHVGTEMINRHYGRWLELGSDEETRQQSADFFAKVSPKFSTKAKTANQE